MPTSTRLLVFFVLAASLAGCSSQSGSTTLTPQTGPQTWMLTAGASSQQEALQALRFYGESVTIDAGDTITWMFPSGEPHTVTFLGPLPAPPPPNAPSAPNPAGGATYDGSVYTSSGFVLLGKTYSLTFPKPGTYTYYCLLHGASGMQGTVVVQNAGAPYPASQTQMQLTATQTAQVQTDLAADLASVAQFPYATGGPHVAAGLSPGLNSGGPSKLTVLRFLDDAALAASSVTISAGSAVTWTNLSSNEPHTVTFAPAGQPFPVLPPLSPPSGGTSYDGSALVNSGVIPPGKSFTVTFPKAGTYTYHCLFHDDTENMVGTVVVQ